MLVLLPLQQGELGVGVGVAVSGFADSGGGGQVCALGVAAHLLSKRFFGFNFPACPNQRSPI